MLIKRRSIAAIDSGTLEAIDMTDYLYDPDDEDAYNIALALRCRFDLRDGKPRSRFGSP